MLSTRTPCVAILIAAVALGAPELASGARTPSLRIVSDWPLKLRGAGFHPRERVVVTVHMGNERWTRHTRSNSAGAFRTRFARLRLRYCAVPLTITARGARGDVARAPLAPRECAPD